MEAMTKVLGPSEMDPYAVQWEEQPVNILKGFIVYFPDMERQSKAGAVGEGAGGDQGARPQEGAVVVPSR